MVIISPVDRDLIVEGSETRRKFIDHVISQSDKQYLYDLVQYHKVLSQRNALLKYFSKNRTFNEDNLLVYNEQLENYAKPVHEKRKKYIELIDPILQNHYQSISNGTEIVSLQYNSQLNDKSLSELLTESLPKDRINQYTSVGIHRDELDFLIDGYPINRYGSQGQQKSYLIALKLAQFDLIQKETLVTPILLLDDIFDKLDDERVGKLIKMVKDQHFGQIFISDTHLERTEKVVRETHQSYKMIVL